MFGVRSDAFVQIRIMCVTAIIIILCDTFSLALARHAGTDIRASYHGGNVYLYDPSEISPVGHEL